MQRIEEYDYDLPRELIAQEPLAERADARMLIVDRKSQHWESSHVRDFCDQLRKDDCLVLNDTRVLPARLLGYRQKTGGRWQGLFLQQADDGTWKVMGKTRGKLKPGESIVLLDRHAREGLTLLLLAPLGDGLWAVRPSDSETTLLELLEVYGRVPLPPYIRGGVMHTDDIERYQTVFAENPGSVAAPTAGLHFTPSLMDQIQDTGAVIARVTLHVGIGTFRPISTGNLNEHVMHSEWGSIGSETAERINGCRSRGGRTIAVGTTVVRLLESAADSGTLRAWSGETNLFIRPPFSFQVTDAMLTNYHLPRSTLLVLVRTFGGDDLIRKAYQYAVTDRYRFYSYGDCMLIT